MVDWLKAAALRTSQRLADFAGASPVSSGRSSWFPLVIREPFTGAWQQNQEITPDTVLANPTVWACVTLIAQDIAKLKLRLVEQDDNGVWSETTNPAYSPVLRKPNRYQTIVKFVEQWMFSKLIHGNTYVLKSRDSRGVVTTLYVLDPSRVWPLITADGAVYYSLHQNHLAQVVPDDKLPFIVPASEIIHDPCCCIFHPLIGVSPIFAAGLAALQGLRIQNNSLKFFSNASQPGGVLTAPGAIGDDTAGRLKEYWESKFNGENVGKIAILGDGLDYKPLSVNFVDSELIAQLDWTAKAICECFHVPPFMVGEGDRPAYAKAEPFFQQYYSQCLQSYITNFETVLDEGLELPTYLGTEFDIDDLLWMDSETRTNAARDAIGAGALSPDEARFKYYGLGPVEGGNTPYMQQQMFSLAALAQRDAADPFAKPPAAAPADPANQPPPDNQLVKFCRLLEQKIYAA